MIHRKFFSLIAHSAYAIAFDVAMIMVCVPLAAATDVAKSVTAKTWQTPRTVDGQPDLQGNWTNATITPMERPVKFGDRRVLSDAEVAEQEHAEAGFNEAASAPTDPKTKTQDLPNDCGKGFKGADCGYNFFWIDSGTKVLSFNGERRSSMIVEPANGRVPPLKPERQQTMMKIRLASRDNFDGPEVRPLSERCLLTFGSISGPPMLPSLYNNNYQIVQNKDTVMILVEMIHDARLVRLGGTHLPQSIRKWMGDSIGHWEGDTLVVETTNFTNKEYFRGATENLKITERFTRVGPHTINYKFTAEDSAAFTAPFSGELVFNKSAQPIYEYACHEGNYALPGILAGARAEEKKALSKL